MLDWYKNYSNQKRPYSTSLSVSRRDGEVMSQS